MFKVRGEARLSTQIDMQQCLGTHRALEQFVAETNEG